MIRITSRLFLKNSEVEFHYVRAQGPGGQHVNKTSSAVQLRFDIRASSLPDDIKARLLASSDQRISREGVLVIKAQQQRSQERNREDAVRRLVAMIREAMRVPKARRPTRVPLAAKRRRLESKTQRGRLKRLRGKVSGND